jgi:hypothetical protein
MLRFRALYPPSFVSGFIAGFREAGGELPSDWREVSEALDLYALADFLTRPPGTTTSLRPCRLSGSGFPERREAYLRYTGRDADVVQTAVTHRRHL